MGRGMDTAFFAMGLLTLARLRKDRKLARYAYACIVAVLLTGLVVNVVRVGTGRPRPRTGNPDRWTGPTLIYRHQSFPSGHTSASFTAAGALLVANPAWGAVALVSAGGVGWASMMTRAHYLSDVWVGMVAGLAVGTAAGLGARRLNRQQATN